MKIKTITAIAVATSALLVGCADQNGLGLTTSSVSPSAALTPKADPACATLTSQISTLRSEGIADKVEKAAIKKYKMTTADLAKADQLNKANAEFLAKCTPPAPQQTAAADPAAAAATSAATQAAGQATSKAADAAAAKAAAAVAKQ